MISTISSYKKDLFNFSQVKSLFVAHEINMYVKWMQFRQKKQANLSGRGV